MIITKKSKNPRYDDPSAFRKQFPRIELLEGHQGTLAATLVNEKVYKMGKLRATVTEPSKEMTKYFMSVHGRDRYPTWDEIVWLRYNLIPDSADMALKLPNLNRYINHEYDAYKFVFTLEQLMWTLEPEPLCTHCLNPLRLEEIADNGYIARHACDPCGYSMSIDMRTWNEEHGNGFQGKRL